MDERDKERENRRIEVGQTRREMEEREQERM